MARHRLQVRCSTSHDLRSRLLSATSSPVITSHQRGTQNHKNSYIECIRASNPWFQAQIESELLILKNLLTFSNILGVMFVILIIKTSVHKTPCQNSTKFAIKSPRPTQILDFIGSSLSEPNYWFHKPPVLFPDRVWCCETTFQAKSEQDSTHYCKIRP